MSEDKENIEQKKKNKQGVWKKLLGLNQTYKLYLCKCLFIVFLICIISFISIRFLHIKTTDESNKKFKIEENINKSPLITIEKVGEMVENRFEPHLINLKNGEILIVGGYKKEIIKSTLNKQPPDYRKIYLTSAEIYNPNTKTFRKISDMKHSECLATYIMDDGRVLLLSKNKNCQIFDNKTESFSLVFPGIKDLHVDRGILNIINKGDNIISIFPSSMSFLIELNIATGKYKKIFDNKNKGFLYSVPIDNKILCIASIIVKSNNGFKLFYRETPKIINKDITLYDIKTHSMEKISELETLRKDIILSKFTDNKIFMRSIDKKNLIIDEILSLKDKTILIDSIPRKPEDHFLQKYYILNNYIIFPSGEIYDYEFERFIYLNRNFYHLGSEFIKIGSNKLLILGKSILNNNTKDIYTIEIKR